MSVNNTATVPVPTWLFANADLSVWNTLSSAERELLAQVLCQHLRESGYDFQKWRFEQHGPDAEQVVLVLTDENFKQDFALIPGGTLLPGYDETQLDCFAEIDEMVEGELRAFVRYRNGGVQEERLIWQQKVFASKAACDLRRKPAVSIAPFLMMVTSLLELPSKRRGAVYSPVKMRWKDVGDTLSRYNWSLPTTEEFEWALQGGQGGVFYWGDRLPDFVLVQEKYYDDDEDEEVEISEKTRWLLENSPLLTASVTFNDVMWGDLELAEEPAWPHYNRFGLKAMLAQGCWCEPSTEPEDPCPLIVRGGVSHFWPWQSCGEWLRMLSAAEARLGYDTDYGDWNTLRPAIKLGSDRQ
jgi:hypothetical protein